MNFYQQSLDIPSVIFSMKKKAHSHAERHKQEQRHNDGHAADETKQAAVFMRHPLVAVFWHLRHIAEVTKRIMYITKHKHIY